LSSAFLTWCAMRRLLNVRVATALCAGRFRIRAATRFSFRGLIRRLLTIAWASWSSRPRGCFGLLMSASLRLLVGRVAGERAGRGELAELVADHVLVHLHGQELVAVIDTESEAHELRQDRRAARPDPDDLVTARRPRGIGLVQKVSVDERTFPDRTRHITCPCC